MFGLEDREMWMLVLMEIVAGLGALYNYYFHKKNMSETPDMTNQGIIKALVSGLVIGWVFWAATDSGNSITHNDAVIQIMAYFGVSGGSFLGGMGAERGVGVALDKVKGYVGKAKKTVEVTEETVKVVEEVAEEAKAVVTEVEKVVDEVEKTTKKKVKVK